MLYYLFDFLNKQFNLAGAGLFQYISFRAASAAMISLLIAMIFGKRLINLLRKKQVGESIRELGLEGQAEKKGTPTMGGLIILAAIVVPVLLFAKIKNVYIVLILICTAWLGLIGFIDDYIKVFKKDKGGLAGKFKIIGQVGIGIIIGSVLYFHKDVVVRDYDNVYIYETNASGEPTALKEIHSSEEDTVTIVGKGELRGEYYYTHDTKSSKTNLPFYKNNEFDYGKIFPFLPEKFTWILYVIVAVIIITGVSNGANITDGIDGLAAGTSAIIALTLAVFAYLSGNAIFAEYLNILFIPDSGELVIYCAAFIGACIGFLWYNAYPAQVFMGDTGSLSLGGIIAVLALSLRKELLIPVICGVFLIENLSVMLQVGWFKYTRKRFGTGRRIFKMSPLHHHYQKQGYHESKIVTRFWIIGILLAVISIATLKVR